MTPTDWLDALERDGTALRAAAARDLDAPVTSCGDWDCARLLLHCGRLYRRIDELVATRRLDGNAPLPPQPSSADSLGYVDTGLTGLLRTLRSTDPTTPVWNWSPLPDTASFWARRMAHETAVHRWDAERATGTPAAIEPALAADGVDEVFEVFLPRVQAQGPVEGLSGTLHLHATDPVAAEWLVALSPASVSVRHEHGKGDAAVRGTVSDLLLALWGRVRWTDLEVYGDPALLRRWTHEVHF